jgi:hypothetical protein
MAYIVTSSVIGAVGSIVAGNAAAGATADASAAAIRATQQAAATGRQDVTNAAASGAQAINAATANQVPTLQAGAQAARTDLTGATNAAIDTQKGGLQKIQGALSPYTSLGASAVDQYRALLGIGGGGAGGVEKALQSTPGYQFTKNEALQGVTNQGSAAFGGGGLSGNTLEALQNRAAGLADTTYQNAVGNAAGAVGTGLNAAGQLAGYTAGEASNVSNLQAGLGTNLANVDTGTASRALAWRTSTGMRVASWPTLPQDRVQTLPTSTRSRATTWLVFTPIPLVA